MAKDKLVFVDESGATTSMTRTYGRAPPDQRVVDGVPQGHYIIAAEVSLLGIRSMVLGVGVADVAVSPVVRTNADGSGDGVGTARLPEGEPWPPAI